MTVVGESVSSQEDKVVDEDKDMMTSLEFKIEDAGALEAALSRMTAMTIKGLGGTCDARSSHTVESDAKNTGPILLFFRGGPIWHS